MKNLKIAFAVAFFSSVAVSSSAIAACDQSSASSADNDLWATHGCWVEFFNWEYQAYNMTQSQWDSRGWFDACNSNLEYPKHWNAAYLVTYGLLDNQSQSFHGTADYRPGSEAASGNFHPHTTHEATDDTGIFGRYIPNVFSADELQTSCLLYNASVANANPASRAGDFMHEGWHGWMRTWSYSNGDVGGHRPGPQGACTINGCDYFYWHGISAYAFGAMWQNDGTAQRFHSPNQVQVEFLCDVSDQPQWWVPASVRLAAAADANTRAAQRFINGPGYTCGSPRPW